MTRKKFIKLCMANFGYSRNEAEESASHIVELNKNYIASYEERYNFIFKLRQSREPFESCTLYDKGKCIEVM